MGSYKIVREKLKNRSLQETTVSSDGPSFSSDNGDVIGIREAWIAIDGTTVDQGRAVVGATYHIKDALKALGFVWMPAIEAWYIPRVRYDDFPRLLDAIASEIAKAEKVRQAIKNAGFSLIAPKEGEDE